MFGTVGRLQAVKNQALLARAFLRLLEIAPDLRRTVRLVIVGDGPARAEIAGVLADRECLRTGLAAGCAR